MFALTKFSTGKCDLLILQSYFRIDPVLGSLVIKQQESSELSNKCRDKAKGKFDAIIYVCMLLFPFVHGQCH